VQLFGRAAAATHRRGGRCGAATHLVGGWTTVRATHHGRKRRPMRRCSSKCTPGGEYVLKGESAFSKEGGRAGGWRRSAKRLIIALLTRTGPRCISFRCKITLSLAQGAVHDAEADVADPVFVRSTITGRQVGRGRQFFSTSEVQLGTRTCLPHRSVLDASP